MKNEEKNILSKLEELNYEYQKDGYYNYGKSVKNFVNLISKMKLYTAFLFFKSHLKNKKNRKIRTNINTKMEFDNSNPIIIHNKEGKSKIVIYTCITGNYDEVIEPVILETKCEYVLFTNNKDIKSKNWQIRLIPDEINKLGTNAEINRYIKMHPKEFFEDFDYSIYVDGNIKIISNISTFVDSINKKTGLAIHKHGSNICIYQEIKDCITRKKGNKNKLKEQYKKYMNQGFPKKFGMFQCSIIASDLHNINSIKILNDWWNEYIISKSSRDQIALPYVLYKNNYKPEDVGNLGEDISKNVKVKTNSHL